MISLAIGWLHWSHRMPIFIFLSYLLIGDISFFCSREGGDLESLGDGLLLQWEGRSLYLFPSIPLLVRVIAKLEEEQP